jgi:hypothetical protein
MDWMNINPRPALAPLTGVSTQIQVKHPKSLAVHLPLAVAGATGRVL